MKYFFFFLLVTAAAYALSTLFLSYLDRELVKDLPLPASGNPSVERKVTPPLPPADYSKVRGEKDHFLWSENKTLRRKLPELRKSPV